MIKMEKSCCFYTASLKVKTTGVLPCPIETSHVPRQDLWHSAQGPFGLRSGMT